MPLPDPNTEIFRDHIATVDDTGKRIWIYPKKQLGPLFHARTIVSIFLLIIFIGTPFIKMNGDPFLMFNILERKFILFGITFLPQDFYLFGLAMITFMIFIALFTAVFGRLFCGWVCPQTIFMEMVFRKIEYLIEGDANKQRRLNIGAWTPEKYLKKGLKHTIFFVIAVLISNVFLSYIIGVDQTLKIVSEPVSAHMSGFIAMIIFSIVFYFVFSWLREQVCTVVCPYGRMQGVLLDEDSIVVHYDFNRGEPRGKISKKKPGSGKEQGSKFNVSKLSNSDSNTFLRSKSTGKEKTDDANILFNLNEDGLGDCIDCGLCVRVCPTGIDIRNGTQLECINCTACIDACNEIMEKVERPKGLIRYASFRSISENKLFRFTLRAKAYSAVLVFLLIIQGFLLVGRSDLEITVLRTPGMMYQEIDENYISNLYNYKAANKTKDPINFEIRLKSPEGKIRMIGENHSVPGQGTSEGVFFVDLGKEGFNKMKTRIVLEIWDGNKKIGRAKATFMGPIQ